MLQPTNTIYNTALYCRLSKDDGYSDRDSLSIENQRDMLTRYCNEHGMHIYDCYVDDGYSGTNFERPAFKKMIEDIENGKVNCVITKDQSRLERNHLEAGYYMEIFFPEHDVRYIALNDGVDTINASTMDIAPFRNLLNEMYAKDISVKIKASLLNLQKQGCYLGTKAPYGYKRDPNDKHHLIIDERYAPIIRRIFHMYVDEGIGCHTIAKTFTAEKIPRPSMSEDVHSCAYDRFNTEEEQTYRWSNHMVHDLIRNPVYAGNTRAQYRTSISIKSKKKNPKGSQMFIVPNTHEAIIPQEKWDLAQTMLSSRRRDRLEDGFENIFTGFLKCADCGRTMSVRHINFKIPRPEIIDQYRYICVQYRHFGSTGCTVHRIEARDLHEAVLADIRRLARYAIDHDDKMIGDIISKLNADKDNDTQKAEKELKKVKKRLEELDKMFAALFEEKVNSNINERNYKQLTTQYETEQLTLEQKISEYEKIIRDTKIEHENASEFVDLIKNYDGITELTAATLHTLIEKIVVHEAEVIDRERVQKIEIYYKFVGKFDDMPENTESA